MPLSENKIPVKISLVTTCKGRLSYLKESIKTWLNINYSNFDIVIVDYDCPDGTGKYIGKHKKELLRESKALDIHVKKICNKPVFNICDARNAGIDSAGSELIFMVDTDVHIADRNILAKIAQQYEKGIIFFTNVAILTTNFEEGHLFFRAKYGIENIKFHSFLPTHCIRVGLSGTACFKKEIYTLCGKFNLQINKSGWGGNDLEFYTRYLNYFYYKIVNEDSVKSGKKLSDSLNQALKSVSILPPKVFKLIDNSAREKHRFYKNTNLTSSRLNQSFIRALLETDGEKYGWMRRTGKKNNEGYKVLQLSRYRTFPIPVWFRYYYYYYLGHQHYIMNNYTESKKYFKEALKIKDITTYFRWKTLFYLSSICKSENKKNNVYTKLEERELKKKKNKSDGLYTREASEMIYRMGSIYKLNKNYKKARAAFELLLNESSNMDIIDGVCFHLGEICFILNNFVAAKQYFKQCLKHNPEHNKALELLNRC